MVARRYRDNNVDSYGLFSSRCFEGFSFLSRPSGVRILLSQMYRAWQGCNTSTLTTKHNLVEIFQLSGQQLCKLQVDKGCTVQMVKFEIQRSTDIPWMRQHLIFGDEVSPLEDLSVIGDLADAAGCLALHLIQLARPIVEPACEQVKAPMALLNAIQAKDVQKCLALLACTDLASLNELDYWHSSVLHHAAWSGFADVCEAILERPDFTQADTLDHSGMTALHFASHRDHLGVVQTLLLSPAFTAVDSADAQFDRTAYGYSARDIALACGHHAIVQAIDAVKRP